MSHAITSVGGTMFCGRCGETTNFKKPCAHTVAEALAEEMRALAKEERLACRETRRDLVISCFAFLSILAAFYFLGNGATWLDTFASKLIVAVEGTVSKMQSSANTVAIAVGGAWPRR